MSFFVSRSSDRLYLLLKHYRGGPEAHGRVPAMDQWAPEDVEAPMAFLRHVSELLEDNGEYVDDIDGVLARVRARGAELVGEVERYEDSFRLCYVRGRRESSSGWRSRPAGGLRPAARRLASPRGPPEAGSTSAMRRAASAAPRSAGATASAPPRAALRARPADAGARSTARGPSGPHAGASPRLLASRRGPF